MSLSGSNKNRRHNSKLETCGVPELVCSFRETEPWTLTVLCKHSTTEPWPRFICHVLAMLEETNMEEPETSRRRSSFGERRLSPASIKAWAHWVRRRKSPAGSKVVMRLKLSEENKSYRAHGTKISSQGFRGGGQKPVGKKTGYSEGMRNFYNLHNKKIFKHSIEKPTRAGM